jgi:hypothetical protein
MDLFIVMRGERRLTYGFLCISWAITSAIDFDSEVIRYFIHHKHAVLSLLL